MVRGWFEGVKGDLLMARSDVCLLECLWGEGSPTKSLGLV